MPSLQSSPAASGRGSSASPPRPETKEDDDVVAASSNNELEDEQQQQHQQQQYDENVEAMQQQSVTSESAVHGEATTYVDVPPADKSAQHDNNDCQQAQKSFDNSQSSIDIFSALQPNNFCYGSQDSSASNIGVEGVRHAQPNTQLATQSASTQGMMSQQPITQAATQIHELETQQSQVDKFSYDTQDLSYTQQQSQPRQPLEEEVQATQPPLATQPMTQMLATQPATQQQSQPLATQLMTQSFSQLLATQANQMNGGQKDVDDDEGASNQRQVNTLRELSVADVAAEEGQTTAGESQANTKEDAPMDLSGADNGYNAHLSRGENLREYSTTGAFRSHGGMEKSEHIQNGNPDVDTEDRVVADESNQQPASEEYQTQQPIGSVDSDNEVPTSGENSGVTCYHSKRLDMTVAIPNPYARIKSKASAASTTTASVKRTIDQISTSSNSNPPADPTSMANASAQSAAMSNLSPKRVYNPYVKTPNATTLKSPPSKYAKSLVKNPYAKAEPFVVTAPKPLTLTIDGAKVSVTQKAKPSSASGDEPNSEAAPNNINISVTRPIEPISRSLSLAERLPSRNVSYQPAEIITVGELYRYLYHMRIGANGAGTNDAIFRELTSIRITGILHSVSSAVHSGEDGGTGELFKSGSFLLVGDPLEKTRFAPVQSKLNKMDTSSITTATPAKGLRSNPASILRNRATPAPSSVALAAKTPASESSISKESEPSSSEGLNTQSSVVKTPAPAKTPNRGLLNNKSKKLVYTGKPSSSLSSSSESLLGGRKFTTPKPKPINTMPSVGKNGMGPLSSMKRGGLTTGLYPGRKSLQGNMASSSTAVKNPKPDFVIQTNPSPIVPVWIGSSYECDGLDGSVVGDLVMIMGEIVIEYCVTCREGSDPVDESPDAETDAKDDSQGNDEQQTATIDSSGFIQIQGVMDAATRIAECAVRDATSQDPHTQTTGSRRNICSRCIKFVKARIVKKANGTDMNLQKETITVRRKYIAKRRRQMESIMPGSYAVGCGPYLSS